MEPFIDVDFDRESARELYDQGYRATLSPRWARVTDPSVVRFVDIVNMIHGHADMNGMISCPFHGRDSHPSFKLYPRGAWCFGCPPGSQYYDTVRFVAAKLGYTYTQAIAWLERKYELPPLDAEEDEDTEGEYLNFSRLAPAYIQLAASEAQKLDPELIREYIAIYFEASPGRADQNNPDSLEKVMPMARVLGTQRLEKIKRGV